MSGHLDCWFTLNLCSQGLALQNAKLKDEPGPRMSRHPRKAGPVREEPTSAGGMSEVLYWVVYILRGIRDNLIPMKQA